MMVLSCQVDVATQLAVVHSHRRAVTASGASKDWQVAALQEAGAQGDGLEAVQCPCHGGHIVCVLVPAAAASQQATESTANQHTESKNVPNFLQI